MKIKFYNTIKTFLIFLVLVSCAEDYPGTELKVSFPAIALNGNRFVSILEGENYVEAGAIATLGEVDVSDEVVITSNLNENVAGLYTITYSITQTNEVNEESTRTTTRLVAVIKPDAVGNDLSGQYHRASNNRLSTVTKLAPGFYRISDCWGTASSGGNPLAVPSYLVNTGGSDLVFRNEDPGTPFTGNFGTGTVLGNGDLSLNTTLINSGSPVVRTNVWIKD